MASPGFNHPAFSQDPRAVQSYPGRGQTSYSTSTTPPAAAGTVQAGQFAHVGVDAAASAQLEGALAAPPAGAHETGRMTVEDTIWKTAGLFAFMLVFAVVGFFWTLAPALSGGDITLAPWIIGLIGGGILGLVNAFKKTPSVPLIFAYAGFEGLFVGGISAYFEVLFPGIVMQATLATVSVVGVTLALFASGKVRASARGAKILLIAMVGYLVFSLVNMVLMFTGALGDGAAWGLRSSVEIMGIPLGVIIGVLVVFMAAYSLVLDFDQIQQGVRNGVPRKFGWQAAFGIMVTVVWLYVEILRMIAILRGND